MTETTRAYVELLDNLKYDIAFDIDRMKLRWLKMSEYLKSTYNNNIDNFIKDNACHEACHIIANELTNKSGEAKDHRSIWRSIYEPLRIKYTNVPLEVSLDDKLTNFSEYNEIKEVNILNKFD